MVWGCSCTLARRLVVGLAVGHGAPFARGGIPTLAAWAGSVARLSVIHLAFEQGAANHVRGQRSSTVSACQLRPRTRAHHVRPRTGRRS